MNTRTLTALVVFVLLLSAGGLWWWQAGRQPPRPAGETVAQQRQQEQQPATPPAYAGSEACAGCHAEAYSAWRDSQHARAMLEASDETVAGDFDDADFSRFGLTSRFFRRDGKFLVRTEGADGRTADFEVRYTFGVEPLQQYLVEFPRGRLQSLTIAWDARAPEQGGQRWFHLYPDERIAPDDPLHWTGIDQNWNYQCADCHSTNLRKNYDAQTDRFATSWSEINVACEACHGPGERHVAWAQNGREGEDKGLTARLDERRGVAWQADPATGNGRRSQPRRSSREIEVCARCHARRGQFSDAHVAGEPLHDAFRPALIEPGLYWPDGQMREEVYNYGSFLTSRMAAAGVTCSDCHEPHGQRLRAEGNAVCAQCHLPSRFDTPGHHHHEQGSDGARCAACHMPTTTYMVVDPRHDHSFRIPRPDRGASLGIPDACTRCHEDRDAAWAATAVRRWYPDPKPGFQAFAETFAAADAGDGRARASLVALAEDTSQPAIVRASALWRLATGPAPDMLRAVRMGLGDTDPNLRAAAVGALSGFDPPSRAQALVPLLHDPVRLVRIETARALAGAPEALLDDAARRSHRAALEEYEAAQRFNADRPEARSNLGGLYAERGQADEAERELRAALAIDRSFVPAWANLADLYRSLGREQEAQSTLRQGLAATGGAAALHHALGLSLVRSGAVDDALDELEAAARSRPANTRYEYVYGIALHSTGQVDRAMAWLEDALGRHPANRDILAALVTMNAEAGRKDEALRHVAALAEAYPGDPEVEQLLRSLR
jgi:predicted CXXCH cytochrome family protein